MVSVHVVRGLIEAVEQAGISGHALLSAAQLGLEQLDAPDAMWPRSTLSQLCELALDLTNDPALGLHWAERVTEGTFALLSPLIAHSSSLRRGLEALAQFHGLLSDQPSFELIEGNDTVTVRSLDALGESTRMQRFVAEM
ncbi:MAG: AraC family transcriptional regulator, partial [Myxococcaceae bacterium]|nr:AraC family transcriptional regulator [Myxococcaceae bacterium]